VTKTANARDSLRISTGMEKLDLAVANLTDGTVVLLLQQ
jgi:hypothetical protein